MSFAQDFQTTPHCVYALMEGWKMLYIGCSYAPERRIQQHKSKGKCKQSARLRIIEWFDNPNDARKYEQFCIRQYTPPLNYHYNADWARKKFKRKWYPSLVTRLAKQGKIHIELRRSGPKCKQ